MLGEVLLIWRRKWTLFIRRVGDWNDKGNTVGLNKEQRFRLWYMVKNSELKSVQVLQEANAKLRLGMRDIYWGECLWRIKERVRHGWKESSRLWCRSDTCKMRRQENWVIDLQSKVQIWECLRPMWGSLAKDDFRFPHWAEIASYSSLVIPSYWLGTG